MRLFLDTEFNGFGGALMSLALASDDASMPDFYEVLEMNDPCDPWVAEHVVPRLGKPAKSRAQVAAWLADYLRTAGNPVIVADWPTDFEHLLALLITGPGMMQPTPDFAMEFKRLPGFNTADHSTVPHNALEDARSLRNYVVATEGR